MQCFFTLVSFSQKLKPPIRVASLPIGVQLMFKPLTLILAQHQCFPLQVRFVDLFPFFLKKLALNRTLLLVISLELIEFVIYFLFLLFPYKFSLFYFFPYDLSNPLLIFLVLLLLRKLHNVRLDVPGLLFLLLFLSFKVLSACKYLLHFSKHHLLFLKHQGLFLVYLFILAKFLAFCE